METAGPARPTRHHFNTSAQRFATFNYLVQPLWIVARRESLMCHVPCR